MAAKQVAVVGAGIAGLGAAWRLAQRGFRVSLFEREQRPGGRARPAIRENFTIERSGAIVRHLLPEVNAVTVTRAEPIRSLSPSEVASAIHAAVPGVSVQVVPDPQLALRAAREELGAEDLLCASGSIYLAGIARRVFCDASSNERVAVSRRGGEA